MTVALQLALLGRVRKISQEGCILLSNLLAEVGIPVIG